MPTRVMFAGCMSRDPTCPDSARTAGFVRAMFHCINVKCNVDIMTLYGQNGPYNIPLTDIGLGALRTKRMAVMKTS